MTDLALQNKALNNKVRRLQYQLHIFRAINEDLLKQNMRLSRDLKTALAIVEQSLEKESAA